MAIGLAPDTTWVQVTAAAAVLTATSVPIPRGVAVIADGEISIGNRSTITHKANADTDGFPVPANTIFEIPPNILYAALPANLNAIYARAAGNVNVWLIYPRV